MKSYCSISGWLVGIGLLLTLSFFGPNVTCRDGWSSPSIGKQGACSHHGGVKKNGLFNFFALIVSVSAGFYTASKLDERDRRNEAKQEALKQVQAAKNKQKPNSQVEIEKTETVDCPNCGSKMKSGRIEQGTYKGREFLWCSAYPKCKKVLHTDEKNGHS